MNMLPEELPVVMMADFSAAGDQFGCRVFSSATMPATCGVAIDVPEPNAYSSSLAARMLTPGAAMSGCERTQGCSELAALWLRHQGHHTFLCLDTLITSG